MNAYIKIIIIDETSIYYSFKRQEEILSHWTSGNEIRESFGTVKHFGRVLLFLQNISLNLSIYIMSLSNKGLSFLFTKLNLF